MKLGRYLGYAMAALASGALPASAESISLKLADSLPLNDRNTQMSIIPWMKLVEERTNGKVTFSHFPNQQLGKGPDALPMTQSGIVDIAYIVPAWTSDKLPLDGVAELPGLYGDACTGAKAYWNLLQEGGLLYETQYKPQGIRPLFTMVQSPYTLFTRDQEIKSLEDFGGLRIRATGSAQTPFVASLGAAPVSVPGPEVHESMSRGTLDALVFPVTGLFVFDVTSYVKFGYTGEIFGGSANVVGMNHAKWDALPEDVKTVIDEASLEIIENFCTGLEEYKKESIAEIKELGIDVVELPTDVTAELDKRREDVQRKWATDFDARGLPGTQMLEAFRAGVADAAADQ